MPWNAHLHIHYQLSDELPPRTISTEEHSGPMRVLQRHYPEGPGVAHHVLLHPPGGLVGGDTLRLKVSLAAHTQALLTTPGAARFYRSQGETAVQSVELALGAHAQLEWLPQETLAYSGCLAENRLQFSLAEGAVLLGWDLLALGLPASDQPFARGQVRQHLSWPGVWLEEGLLDAQDQALLQGPAGLAGHTSMGTLWLAMGTAPSMTEREALLAAARAALPAPSELLCGATSPDPRLIVVRALAPQVEPVMQALRAVRRAWRPMALQREGMEPRVWGT